ncbi:MAG: peptidoglycan DD-metalloendopeptidase family protein [Lachnospiraceae bacterium]|nr:peptidoglycan DD-metalloendopeptidase family protein [Lachnospiraceae bacterium]
MIRMLLITSSVLILGIFCLRKLTFGRITMRVRYALWLPVALRLLFPFSMGESPISVMNVFSAGLSEIQQIQAGAKERDTVRAESSVGIGREAADLMIKSEDALEGATAFEDGTGGYGALRQSGSAENRVSGQSAEAVERTKRTDTERQASVLSNHPYILRIVLGGVWLIGFLSVGCYMLLSVYRFMRYLKKNRSVLSEDMLPEDFAKCLSARDMKVYQVQGLPSPCLVGGHIYVGGRAADDPQSLSHILAHEYSHVRHLDRFWAFLRSFLTAVYWFDPLVWAAAYAARQDSELACDEAAVNLLGESERFMYGRTLLYLLESGDGREECPGLTFMLNRGEKSVRERIGALAGCGRRKGVAPVLALAAALFLCGCAFTGAAQGDAEEALAVLEEVKEEAAEGQDAASRDEAAGGRDTAGEDKTALGQDASEGGSGDSGQTPNEPAEVPSRETDEAAFEEALNYHGVMEGKDDSELFLNREVDYQSYFAFTRGEAENPMENGWYLLCRNEEAGISLYGLYTEEFGFRGLKTLIDDDVNTFDGKWCASLMNVSRNIRVLEQGDDGLPRRFVWKLLAEESSTVEIWRLYSAYRYDTGTVDVKMLSEEECLAWAKEYLTFAVDQEKAKVYVTCDGDMYLGAVDISDYRDWETEEVRIVPDVTDFVLDDPFAGLYSDVLHEGTAVHLAVGLKLKGVEGLWNNGLPVLTVQVVEDENSASGFRLAHPRIDETYVVQTPWQEKELSELRDEIAFINPCPDYNRISDPYGERTHPVTGEVRRHDGVDLAADEGADILAAADGTVSMTGFDAEMGNYVVLWHEQSGRMTHYEHCKTVEVEIGQQVAQGEKIATVGHTGRATGSFLHFAISREDNWEEPYFLDLN